MFKLRTIKTIMYEERNKAYKHLKHCHLDYLDEITDELLKFEILKRNEPYENIENHFLYSNQISKLNTKIYKLLNEIG